MRVTPLILSNLSLSNGLYNVVRLLSEKTHGDTSFNIRENDELKLFHNARYLI